MKGKMPVFLLLWISSAITLPVQAAGEMAFSGTLLLAPPCRINDGNRIDVDFGDRVGVNMVDGVNYRQAMHYQITCDSQGGAHWVLKLSLSGTPSSFDMNALGTNREGLGIRLYSDDKPFPPGTSLEIDAAHPPRLEAVPVKKAGAPLAEGGFEAWATLRADYQ